jgi:hypothetical protein
LNQTCIHYKTIIDVSQHVDNCRVLGRNLDRNAAARQIGTAVSRAPKGTGAAPGIATLTLKYSILAPSPPQTAPQTRLRVNFDGCLSAGPGLQLSETLWWTVRYEIRLARWEEDFEVGNRTNVSCWRTWAMQPAAGRHYSAISDGLVDGVLSTPEAGKLCSGLTGIYPSCGRSSPPGLGALAGVLRLTGAISSGSRENGCDL